MRDLPVACTLSAVSRDRQPSDLLPSLIPLATAREELRDGYRFVFPSAPGAVTAIATVIDAERQCCRFLRFELVVDQDGAPITLDVTGPEGTKGFLAGLLSQAPIASA